MSFPQDFLFADRYRFLSQLDSGGFSEVYCALDMQLDQPGKVAIKLFELSSKDEEVRRECMALFLREAYNLSKLSHPNIIQIHDFGHLHNHYYLVTEYLEGTTLYDIVDKTGPMPEGEVAMVVYEIASALEFLKKHKIVHRDIKPFNIMINDVGDTKLIDFGLARHIEERTVSLRGFFTGTPQYAAPESIRRERHIDSRADIFSLGASCYYFLTKIEPFPGKDPKEVFKSRLNTSPPKPLTQINSSVSPQFADLIHRMIDFDRANRPQVEEVKAILFEIMSNT